ncbi:type II secretion system F family protein [Rhodohalobacter sulfatireducens]|uniref:Type II secretion system F family protein n=1 Tax=Rhodohalobacter sulfatireducens TaxID=2911366 RepID=A0ABS9KI56_9BACT|nr:type II secretion system F family protein [Rhodohalobacter sulfatireducens]MCG2590521.1 type II secretion system F family protein [Rhodohalobacter sulfatireducens]
MPQFRFTGKTKQGKTVLREFEAPSKKSAKERVQKLATTRSLKVESIDEKKRYLYKVRKNGSGPIEGEQQAYSAEDVEHALVKMGYRVDYVRKKWFDFKGMVPRDEIVTFIRLSADLLRQGLPFDQILTLLYEDTTNRSMKEVIRTIQKDLRDGKEGSEVYGKHKDIFGKFAAYMLGVASTSGNMASVFESTAKFVERDADFKKNLRRSLFMPTFTLLAVLATLLFFVGYVFPITAEMFLEFDIQLPPLTANALDISNWLQANWIAVTLAHILPFVFLFLMWKNKKGRLIIDKYLIKLPVIGELLHKTSIEIFSRVFHTLYSGSGQNIEVIRIAAEACRNTYIEKQIKDIAIRRMLEDGAGLIEALEATQVFPKSALSRFRLGAESGSLKENSGQLADYYEKQTTYKMESVINWINLFINFIIFIALIYITIVSSEAAIIKPDYGSGGSGYGLGG